MIKIISSKYIYLCLCLLTAIAASGQSAIHFESGLSWQQIQDKARADHKYIFVDCYATWCAPCKMMDQQVYTRTDVGEAYSSGFINVKVQMDRTKTDDMQTQKWYTVAAWLQDKYNIEALPTFLFFDPEGRLVVQRSGAMEAGAFIQLGKDALDPNLLTRDILNFQPGKLDTAEEAGLINVYATSNKDLAGRIAADYLTRIPKEQLGKTRNCKIMVQFQDNTQVLDVAVNHIADCLSRPVTRETIGFIYALRKQPKVEGAVSKHFEDLNQHRFADTANLKIAGYFLDYPRVKQVALHYIKSLNNAEIGRASNLKFVGWLNNEEEVQALAKKYIAGLNQKEIYTRPMLNFISSFTQSTGSTGMDIFFRHPEKVNAVIGNNYFARDQVIFGLLKKEFDPLFALAKQSGQEPNWQALSAAIAKKYDRDYAEMTVDYARMNWFLYLFRDKRQSQFQPQYLDATITKMQRLRNDTVKSSFGDNFNLNNIAYGAFGHLDDLAKLKVVTNWMSEVIGRNPGNIGDLDTYACLLYRTGKRDSALEMEQKALKMAIERKDKFMTDHARITIDKMKKEEPFWKEKEYQE